MLNNSENDTNEDYNFARCRNCRFPLDKSRDKTVITSDFSYTSTTKFPYQFPFAFTPVKNPIVNSGCPNCGCPQPYV